MYHAANLSAHLCRQWIFINMHIAVVNHLQYYKWSKNHSWTPSHPPPLLIMRGFQKIRFYSLVWQSGLPTLANSLRWLRFCRNSPPHPSIPFLAFNSIREPAYQSCPHTMASAYYLAQCPPRSSSNSFPRLNTAFHVSFILHFPVENCSCIRAPTLLPGQVVQEGKEEEQMWGPSCLQRERGWGWSKLLWVARQFLVPPFFLSGF